MREAIGTQFSRSRHRSHPVKYQQTTLYFPHDLIQVVWSDKVELKPSPIVFINHGKGWYLRPAQKRILYSPVILNLEEKLDYVFAGGIAKPRFSEDSTYALMLLHDLLGLGAQAGVMTQSIQINRPHERWAATVLGAKGGAGLDLLASTGFWELLGNRSLCILLESSC